MAKEPSVPEISQPEPFSGIYGTDDELLSKINQGFAKFPPKLIDEGLGGTYFLYDGDGNICAVWKPSDEEPSAKRNPKEKTEPRSGFSETKGYLREAAAYALDGGFSSVPLTMLARTSNGQCGAIQKYVNNDGSSDEFGSSRYKTDQIHRIGLLDLRLLNTDRHGGNILVSNPSKPTLTPIDHGYALGNKDSLKEILDFEWRNWSQAEEPFSPETKAAVLAVDVERDVKILKSLGIEDDAIMLFRASDAFVRCALQSGWTLQEMADFVCRPDPDQPSQLESLFESALLEKDVLASFQAKLVERVQ